MAKKANSFVQTTFQLTSPGSANLTTLQASLSTEMFPYVKQFEVEVTQLPGNSGVRLRVLNCTDAVANRVKEELVHISDDIVSNGKLQLGDVEVCHIIAHVERKVNSVRRTCRLPMLLHHALLHGMH